MSLDILEGIRWQLRHNRAPTAQQVSQFLNLLAAGENFGFEGPHGARFVLFTPNQGQIDLRQF